MGYPTPDLIPSIKTCDHISAIVCKLFQILPKKLSMTPPFNESNMLFMSVQVKCMFTQRFHMFAIYNFIYTVYYIYNISFSNEVLTTDHLYGSNNRTIISVNLKPCIQLTSCLYRR